MARRGKKGGNNGANNNNNHRQNNNQRNNNGKWCAHCKQTTHNTVECFNKPGNNRNNDNVNPWVHKNRDNSAEDEPRFKYCKFCKDFGHDLANCSVLPKELKAVGIEVQEKDANGLFLPRVFEDPKNRLENKAKVFKDYANPFARETVKPNPFTDLVCTHSSQCQGLCGNKHYMAKTREMKRQLEEVLGKMQCWLDAITRPEEDPTHMEWEDAPMIVIQQVQEPYIPPKRVWNLDPQPVRMLPDAGFAKYLKGNLPFGRLDIPVFTTPGAKMDVDSPATPLRPALKAPGAAPAPAGRHVQFVGVSSTDSDSDAANIS